VTLNDLLKNVWKEAAVRNTRDANIKLIASSFFLMGMAVGDV
jgi:hypothetical protein